MLPFFTTSFVPANSGFWFCPLYTKLVFLTVMTVFQSPFDTVIVTGSVLVTSDDKTFGFVTAVAKLNFGATKPSKLLRT